MALNINDIRNKISETDLAQRKAEFLLSQAPASLHQRIQEFGDMVGDHVVDSPHAKFWRDAYIAAQFSLMREARTVQMLEPIEDAQGKIAPDFQVEIDGTWFRYESVEALPLDRRRSDEFREDRKQGGGKPRNDHVPTKDELIAILRCAAGKKVSKAHRYADCRGLVIMLNTWALMGNDELQEAFTAGTAEAGQVFGEVWVLDHRVARLVWSDGCQACR